MGILGTLVEAAGLVAEGIHEANKQRKLEEEIKKLREQVAEWKALWEVLNRRTRALEAANANLKDRLEADVERIAVLNSRVRMLQTEKRELELELMVVDLPDSPYGTPEGDLEEAILDGTWDTE